MPEVKSCPDCGKLYVKFAGAVCPACRAIRQEQLNAAIGLVKSRPGLALREVGRLCGVSEKVLLDFAEEGTFRRLDLSVSYPCRFCSAPIDNGTICSRCSEELTRHILDLRGKLEQDNTEWRPVQTSGRYASAHVPVRENDATSRKESLLDILSQQSKKRKSHRHYGVIR
ncbi:MAG: hypothetical protein CVV42_04520 [Candidatus Riflebacteria bacterium HGW-Riflebacteria-2]|jgi:hypothetical protein|nr:MAG: hypothetical protein CVV42_04520 [Candidatus Riflebacteria bacterium HGW-Riflebacteria-2]